MLRRTGYLWATCHPWACLLFLLPLLIAYEAGIFWFGGQDADAMRNGADNWLRLILETTGFRAMYWPPIFIVAIFLLWDIAHRDDRPDDLLGAWTGMAVESLVYAFLLWGLAQAPRLADPEHPPEMTLLRLSYNQHLAVMIGFVGAGIYEELLFRLLLYPFLRWLLSMTELLLPIAVGLAMVLSSLAFAGAHHMGPYGEPFDLQIFLFRTAAGMYFAMLFQLRGFGIVVGTHACYDVLVGVSIA